MKPINIHIVCTRPQTLADLTVFLAEKGIPFEVKSAEAAAEPAKPAKPAAGNGAQKPRKKYTHKKRRQYLSVGGAQELVDFASAHPDTTRAFIARRFNVSATTVTRIMQGRHPHQQRGRVSQVNRPTSAGEWRKWLAGEHEPKQP